MGIKAILKKNRLTYMVASAVRKLPYPIYKNWMRLCHAVRGIDPNKVYFSSFGGRSFDDNPKYIAQELHRLCPEARIVFRMSAKSIAERNYPDWVEPVPQFSPRAMMHMATAHVLVKNAQMTPYMLKFADQYYIQPWHGDRAIKRIALDLHPDAKKTHLEWKYMDLGVTGSRSGTEYVMRRALGYNGEILECGCPRNDILINPPKDVIGRVRSSLGIKPDEHIVLYAPTFRRNNTGAKATADFSLAKLREALESNGKRWRVLTRGHTLNTGIRADEGTDVSTYGDVSELLLICDLVISDYSSIVSDFALLRRPVILYHSGDDYSERGMIFDEGNTPYPTAHSEEELLEMARRLPDGQEVGDAICTYYGVHESGTSAKAVAERIRKILNA